MDTIDTTNKFLVAVRGDDVLIMRPPTTLSQADALLLAAYLIALSGKSFEEFTRVYDAVCNT